VAAVAAITFDGRRRFWLGGRRGCHPLDGRRRLSLVLVVAAICSTGCAISGLVAARSMRRAVSWTLNVDKREKSGTGAPDLSD
jgi:hypothetical protein